MYPGPPSERLNSSPTTVLYKGRSSSPMFEFSSARFSSFARASSCDWMEVMLAFSDNRRYTELDDIFVHAPKDRSFLFACSTVENDTNASKLMCEKKGTSFMIPVTW